MVRSLPQARHITARNRPTRVSSPCGRTPPTPLSRTSPAIKLDLCRGGHSPDGGGRPVLWAGREPGRGQPRAVLPELVSGRDGFQPPRPLDQAAALGRVDQRAQREPGNVRGPAHPPEPHVIPAGPVQAGAPVVEIPGRAVLAPVLAAV